MSFHNWVYRKADGQWCCGDDGPDPVSYLTDQVGYGMVSVDGKPNERTQKCDGAVNQARTDAEIAVFDADVLAVKIVEESHSPSILATVGVTVRADGAAAFDALSPEDQKTAVTSSDHFAAWQHLRTLFNA